jgi:rhodanese-related sulfurtransferase
MTRRTKILIAALLSGAVVAGGHVMFRDRHTGLAAVHSGIERQFSDVRHIDGDGLSSLDRKDVVLFDVREASEFSISHLQHAIRVDPAISKVGFAGKFADITKGKTAIFYCSVGQRSSALAHKVQRALLSSGTKAAYNLKGGIFKWHNERRPLVSGAETRTTFIHPYNAVWGRMVKDQKNTRYSNFIG